VAAALHNAHMTGAAGNCVPRDAPNLVSQTFNYIIHRSISYRINVHPDSCSFWGTALLNIGLEGERTLAIGGQTSMNKCLEQLVCVCSGRALPHCGFGGLSSGMAFSTHEPGLKRGFLCGLADPSHGQQLSEKQKSHKEIENYVVRNMTWQQGQVEGMCAWEARTLHVSRAETLSFIFRIGRRAKERA